MGIKVTCHNYADASIKAATDIIREELLEELRRFGSECEERIRNRGAEESWYDHTGTLRSSVGYAVYDKARVYAQSQFETVLSGSAGSEAGRQMVSQLATQYADSYALAVFAAAPYADAVEAIDGKNVLESARIWADNELQRRLNAAKDRAIRRINAL